jgi:hypothetical protein
MAAHASTSGQQTNNPPAIIDEEEDVIDGVIRRTGCEAAYRVMEDCMVETDRDFRACQASMKQFQACLVAQERKKAEKL